MGNMFTAPAGGGSSPLKSGLANAAQVTAPKYAPGAPGSIGPAQQQGSAGQLMQLFQQLMKSRSGGGGPNIPQAGSTPMFMGNGAAGPPSTANPESLY